MRKSELLRALQTEIRRHTFDTFVDQPPSIAQGGKGVVYPGCPACRKRLFTMQNFMDHLAEDVLPNLVQRHIADINFAEFYTSCFPDSLAAETFYAQLQIASRENNELLFIF